MAALDRVEEALRQAGSDQKFGGNWVCPAHEDDRPSLSVASNGHGVALFCHANCPTDDILGVLGLSWGDLMEEDQRREVGRYLYKDKSGVVLFAKIRYQPKGFSIMHPGPNGWERGLGDAERVLYRLPELIEGIAQGKVIYLVEGEKDADRLVANGKVATCNFDGAGKWRSSYTRLLFGARVIIIADRDEQGIEHARRAA